MENDEYEGSGKVEARRSSEEGSRGPQKPPSQRTEGARRPAAGAGDAAGR